MGFQSVVFLTSGLEFPHFLKIVVEGLGTTTCLENVVEASKGMLPVKYFHLNKSSFCCQLNSLNIISLSRH